MSALGRLPPPAFALASLFLLSTVVGCDDAADPLPPQKQDKEAKKERPPPEPEPPPPPPPPEPEAPKLPNTPPNFEAAVEKAAELHGEHRRTFYCRCAYTPALRVARGTCGYKTRADDGLAKRVGWVQVVPTQAFGEHRECWRQKICKDEQGTAYSGVRCCAEADKIFAAMQSDLHNIVPAIQEVAQDRARFPFGEVEGEERMYGACDMEIDSDEGLAEPPEQVRGDIARAYLYMRGRYGDALPMNQEDLERYSAWHTEDPPDEWEIERNQLIAAIQGEPNPLVSKPE